tara:strand:+ start:5086 stop:5607 length:522 start_codon:yes stop_codon:yes gene_type:complete
MTGENRENFAATYAAMSDDDLIKMYTRRHELVEEACVALESEIASREPSIFSSAEKIKISSLSERMASADRARLNPSLLKRVSLVILVAVVTLVPGILVTQAEINAPLWYRTLSAIAGAIGAGVFAMFFGLVALFGARKRVGRGLMGALILTASVGVFSSYILISMSARISSQ